jgi:hypothetical protein
MIHLAHARIEASDDTFVARSFRDRGESAHAEHGKAACRGDPLHDAASDSQSRERTRSRAISDSLQIAETNTCARKQCIDLVEHELRVSLADVDGAFMHPVARAHRERKHFGRTVDRQQYHRRILTVMNALHFHI